MIRKLIGTGDTKHRIDLRRYRISNAIVSCRFCKVDLDVYNTIVNSSGAIVGVGGHASIGRLVECELVG